MRARVCPNGYESRVIICMGVNFVEVCGGWGGGGGSVCVYVC